MRDASFAERRWDLNGITSIQRLTGSGRRSMVFGFGAVMMITREKTEFSTTARKQTA